MNLLLPTLPHHLSFSKSVSTLQPQSHSILFPLTTKPSSSTTTTTTIRMGGGPRTYPGGVSKWQWKRMQANKSKQLLKARLSRERQLFEMRKRAELKAAVSELERPWEAVERAPNLFSVKADEQVKVLADRFQKPGGFDLWSEKDGPQLFESPDELPSARFFPKGVVFSVRPYRKVSLDDDDSGDGGEEGSRDDDSSVRNGGGVEFDDGVRRNDNGNGRFLLGGVDGHDDDGEGYSESYVSDGRNGGSVDGGLRKNGNGNGRRFLLEDDDDDDDGLSSRKNGGRVVEFDGRLRRNGNGSENGRRFRLESDEECSSDSVRSGRSSYGGRLRRNGNGRKFMAEGDEEEYSSDSLRSGGSGVDGRMRRNGNGNGNVRRRIMPKGVVDGFDGEHSSPLNYGRNGDGRMRKKNGNGNGGRFLSEGVDGSDEEQCSSASVSDRRHGGSVGGRFRRNENGNGRRVTPKGVVYESNGERSSPSNYGRNSGDGRMRSGNGRRLGGVDGKSSSAPFSLGRNGGRFDGELRNKGNGRRFVSNDVGGSGRQQRGSDSFAGRSGGKYRRGTSGYAASRRVRHTDSEVYDMDLQQDGSYGFFRRSEQSDSKNW